jgi:hypothetical protein
MLNRAGHWFSVPKSSDPGSRHQKPPFLRQHFLKRLPELQGQRSFLPSFSSSSLSPWTTRSPRLTCVSEGNPRRRLLIVSKKMAVRQNVHGLWVAWRTSSLGMVLRRRHELREKVRLDSRESLCQRLALPRFPSEPPPPKICPSPKQSHAPFEPKRVRRGESCHAFCHQFPPLRLKSRRDFGFT